MARRTVDKQEAPAPAAAGRDPASLPAHQRKRREGILTAAMELLEDGEYDSVQMRDVAERAGVALGTVYRYFSSKEHLYAAALVRRMSVPRLDAGGSAGESDEARLRGRLRRQLRAQQRWPQIMRAEMVLETSTDVNAQEAFAEFARHYQAFLHEALPDTDPERAEDIVIAVNGVMYLNLRQWALGHISMREVERRVGRVLDLVFGPESTD